MLRRSTPCRLLASVAAAVFTALVLAGCGQETPTDYSDAVEQNFLTQCVGTDADNEGFDDDEVDELRDECECAYDTFQRELEFDDFKELDTEVRSDLEALPDNVYDQLLRCVVQS